MDKQLIKKRFTKAQSTYSEEAVVQYTIALKMAALLGEFIKPACSSLLEIGCGTGLFSRLLLREMNFRKVVLNDICPDMRRRLEDILDERQEVSFQPGDAEICPFEGRWDVIASCSAIQWFTDTAAFFRRSCDMLSSRGYLGFSTFGSDNMKEISTLTGSGLPYHTLEELKQMLSPVYKILYAVEEKVVLSFSSPVEVLYHLKRTGVTGIENRKWTKGNLARFCQDYLKQFSAGDAVTLTYHPVYVVAQKND